MGMNPNQQPITGGISIAGVPIEELSKTPQGQVLLDDAVITAIAQSQAAQRDRELSEVESALRNLKSYATFNIAPEPVNPDALGANAAGALAGGLISTLGSGAAGAALGTTVFPGVGTVAGGLIGTVLGAGLSGFNRSNYDAAVAGQTPNLGASLIRGGGEGALAAIPGAKNAGQLARNLAIAGGGGAVMSGLSQIMQNKGQIGINRLLSDVGAELGGQLGGDALEGFLRGGFRGIRPDIAPTGLRDAARQVELPKQAAAPQMVDNVAKIGVVENVDAAQQPLSVAQQMAAEFNEFINGLNQLVANGNTKRAMSMARAYADDMAEQARFDPDPQVVEVSANAAQRALDFAESLKAKPYVDKATKLEADYGIIQAQMQKGKVSINALKAFRNKVQSLVNDSAAPVETRQYAELLRDSVDDEILSLEEIAKTQKAAEVAASKRRKERVAAVAKGRKEQAAELAKVQKERADAIARVKAAKIKQATGDLTQGTKVRDELVALRQDILARSKKTEADFKEKADAVSRVNAAKTKQAIKENLPTENKVRPELVELRKDIEARSKAKSEKPSEADVNAKKVDSESQKIKDAKTKAQDAEKARLQKLGEILSNDMQRLKNIEGPNNERIASGVAKASELTSLRNRAAKIETDPNAPESAKKAGAAIRRRADETIKKIKDRDAAARQAKIKPKAKTPKENATAAVNEFNKAVDVFDNTYEGMQGTPNTIRQTLDSALASGDVVEVDYYAEVTGGNVAKPVLKRKLTIIDSGFDSKGRPWYRTIDQDNGDIQTRKLFDGPEKSRFTRANQTTEKPRYMPVEGDADSVVDTQTGEILSRTGDDVFELTQNQIKDSVSLVDTLRKSGVNEKQLQKALEDMPDERRRALFKEIIGEDC